MFDIKDIVRGSSLDIDLVVSDLNGNDIDLTGKEVIFAVKEQRAIYWDDDDDKSTALIYKRVTEHENPDVDPEDGGTRISLTHKDLDLVPAQYWYGIAIVEEDQEPMPSDVSKFVINPRGVESSE